jgi:hypothetical protein
MLMTTLVYVGDAKGSAGRRALPLTLAIAEADRLSSRIRITSVGRIA